MSATIVRLFPSPAQEQALKGTYLSHNLREFRGRDEPFIYSDFVVSLDGRIAVPHPESDKLDVPTQISNDHDWRLFQELAIQADIILVSGAYMSNLSKGKSHDIITVYEDDNHADLASWRHEQGDNRYPDYAVISNKLNFEITPQMKKDGRRVIVITGSRSTPADRERLEAQGAEIVDTGEARVSGSEMQQALAQLGYRLIFSPAGSRVHHMLIASQILDRLYLTQTHRIIGGAPYLTLVEGDPLVPFADFQLSQLYLDPEALNGAGQHYLVFDRHPP